MSEEQKHMGSLEEQFHNLPLPDMEASWKSMEALLDEEPPRRRRLLPPFLRSCAPWALLLLLLAGGWWLIDQQQSGPVPATASRQVPVPSATPRQPQASSPRTTAPSHLGTTEAAPTGTASSKPALPPGAATGTGAGGADAPAGSTATASTAITGKTTGQLSRTVTSTTRLTSATARTGRGSIGSRKGRAASRKASTPASVQVPANISPSSPRDAIDRSAIGATPDRVLKDKPAEKGATPAPSDTAKRPALPQAAVDSPIVASPVPSPTKSKKKVKNYWSAGLALQQQIPIAGQSAVPYNYQGRTGSLYDYIPSVYLRFHRGDRWFIQGEFRYGAPQSVRELSFSRQTRFDTTASRLQTTTVRLKKTYYHQLPLSVNYLVLPNLSIGAGAIYSRFYGAVTEEEVKNVDVQSGTETVNRKIVNIRGYTDSFLYQSQVHLLLQTEYQWKRWALGLRYTRDLQPFIRYTRPDGTVYDEKNFTFQAILRFRIWQSKR